MLLLLALCTISSTFSQQQAQSLEIKVLFNPATVLISGQPTLYYELHLLNKAADPILLHSLYITRQAGNWRRVIEKNDLQKKYSPEKKSKDQKALLLPPGASGIVYLELAVPANTTGSLKHWFLFQTMHKDTAGLQPSAAVSINYAPPASVVVGPPVSEGAWAAIYEPSWERGHRRVVYAPDGKSRIPGRFAIDFIKLDQQGKYATGDENEIKNWLGYGAAIIAVADGVVASTLNDFPESKTLAAHPAWPSEKATGNYISLDIGNGLLVFYEHLQPGSIKVKAGQAVKKGDTLAALGFTGQTTGPHLHFHIANANSPLGAEGIPFAFEQFTMLGGWPDFSQFGKQPWMPVKATSITRERPAPNTVIRFRP